MILDLRRTFAALLAPLVLAAVTLIAVVGAAPSAGALVTVTVDSNGDTAGPSAANCPAVPAGTCTLRDAIEGVANTTDDDVEVIIPADVGTIVLTVNQLVYDGGSGDDALTISGSGNVIDQQEPSGTLRVLAQINTSETLTISGVTITGGGNDGGSGIAVFDAAGLSLTDVTVAGNDAGGNGGGGMFVNVGPVTIVDSTISGNTAGTAAGMSVSASDVTMVNSTVTGNTATNSDGVGGLEFGNLALVYSTIADNTGTGVLSANLLSVGGTLSSFGSVVALPIGGPNCQIATTTSAGYNWDDDGTCGFNDTTDHSDAGDPELGGLADNGGSTQTRAPAQTSGLVDDIPTGACGDGDALAGFAITTDQRGEPRPDPDTQLCDIGAVELQPPVTPVPPDPPGPTPIVIEPTFTG